MIPQTDKDKAKKLGIDIDVIIAAHSATEEISITLPEGNIYTDAQLSERDKNTKAEGVKEGEKNSLPLAVAEINKHTGAGLDTSKIDRFGDIGKMLKVKMSETDDTKLQAATRQVNELLEAQTKLTTERDNALSTANKVKFDYGQYKHMPADRNSTMNEGEYLSVLQARGIEAKEDGIYRNGVLMTDSVTKGAMPHAEAYKQLFTEFKWVNPSTNGGAGGRGGGNSGGAGGNGKARSYTEALEKWKGMDAGNTNEMSAEFQTFIQAEAKGNPSFAFEQ